MTTESTREEVERLLRRSSPHPMDEPGQKMSVRCDVAHELARAWLALHDAPVREVDGKTVRLVAVD